jgi:hypothetical protein
MVDIKNALKVGEDLHDHVADEVAKILKSATNEEEFSSALATCATTIFLLSMQLLKNCIGVSEASTHEMINDYYSTH